MFTITNTKLIGESGKNNFSLLHRNSSSTCFILHERQI